ncbi:lysozyme [Cimex lectularius]|uniref:lysozyme n=1 Tax=Cimex lectularius TaxID=79782 RepID=A0A8I6RR00_CIMLE|nr:lysozyme [Cimex lectularius]
MMKFIIVCNLIAAISIVATEGKTFAKCDLAKELLKKNFSKEDMPKWLCLVDKLSGYSTSKEESTAIGTKTIGLFQFSEETDCGTKTARGRCNAKCDALKTDDITTAARCALQMNTDRQFNFWPIWKNSTCRTNTQNYVCSL